MKKYLVLLLVVLTACSKNVTTTSISGNNSSKEKVENIVKESQERAIEGTLLNAIAATVNDEVITAFDVKKEMDIISKMQPTKLTEKEVLELMIDRILIRQRIKEANIRVSDDDVRLAAEEVKKQNNLSQKDFEAELAKQGLTYERYLVQLREQIERIRLVSSEVRSKIHISESDIQSYFKSHPEKYSEEDEYKIRRIFFKTDSQASPEAIKKQMDTILFVLGEAKSGKNFVELAKQYSNDPEVQKDGGDLGRLKKTDMKPELYDAVKNLSTGDVSELVATDLGISIIKLDQRYKGRLKSYEDSKSEIQNLLYQEKTEEKLASWSKELRSKATIENKNLFK